MSIARITPVVGSLYALMRNRLGLNVETPLGTQEISCTVAPARPSVVLGHEPIAGFARDFGTVADEAAMLALHTLDSTTLSISPTFVAPGDSVLRTDDPGWRWHCIANHGQALSDWERRPLAGALSGLAVTGHSHAISAITGLQAALDGKADSDELDAKQDALANAAVVSDLSDVSGSLAYKGMVIGGGGGGGALSAHAMLLAAAPLVYYSGAALLDADGVALTDGGEMAQATDLSGNGNHWLAPAGYRPTLDADGCAGHPCIAFGGGAHATCTTGTVDLLNHTIIMVARSRAVNSYGRLLVVGLPASGYDYNVQTAEVLTFDNIGTPELRINSGNANYGLYLSQDQIGRPAGWGVYIYRIGRPAASTAAASARISADGGVAATTGSTSYPSSGTGIHAGCAWHDGAAAPAGARLTGDIALCAILPRGMPDGWCDTLAGLLRVELGI